MKAPRRAWVVRAGDGATVADILAKMKEDARAVEDGRVFVGAKRVTRFDAPIAIGDELSVGEMQADREVEILFEKDGLVACNKPAGIPTVPDHAGSSHALVAQVARTIGKFPDELRVTSRLDREVSGVVIFALDAEAEARLKRAREDGAYHRRYVALASLASSLSEDTLVWDGAIGAGKDARHRVVGGRDAKPSRTNVKVVERTTRAALLAVDPITGRTHQIRVHAAHAGAPLLGDRDYGGPTRFTLEGGRVVALTRIALHAARVAVLDVVVTAPVPKEMTDLWVSLGGTKLLEVAVE